MNLKKRTFKWLMGIRAPHGENNRALQSREGMRAGEGADFFGGERQGPTTGPVLGAFLQGHSDRSQQGFQI